MYSDISVSHQRLLCIGHVAKQGQLIERSSVLIACRRSTSCIYLRNRWPHIDYTTLKVLLVNYATTNMSKAGDQDKK